jgi:hypothetical protein
MARRHERFKVSEVLPRKTILAHGVLGVAARCSARRLNPGVMIQASRVMSTLFADGAWPCAWMLSGGEIILASNA